MHETVNQIVYRFSVVSASCNAAIPGQKVQCRRRVICVYSKRCSVICNGALQFFNSLIVKELQTFAIIILTLRIAAGTLSFYLTI